MRQLKLGNGLTQWEQEDTRKINYDFGKKTMIC
jgi:hypothetical protein